MRRTRPNNARDIVHPRLYDLLPTLMAHGRERQHRDQLLNLAAVRAGQDSLDIGCGAGTLVSAAWRRTRPDGIVHGIAVSPKMIARARWKARRSESDVTLHFHGGDAAALQFRNKVFDVVLITTVMHVAPEAERMTVVKEASRALRSSGRLLIVEYGGPTRAGLVARHQDASKLRSGEPGLLLARRGFDRDR